MIGPLGTKVLTSSRNKVRPNTKPDQTLRLSTR